MKKTLIAIAALLVLVAGLRLAAPKAERIVVDAFDPERYLSCYQARDDVALVRCRVREVEYMAERKSFLDRIDLDRIDLDIERVIWTRPPRDSADTTGILSIFRSPAERIWDHPDWGVRIYIGPRSDGRLVTPARRFLEKDHRYWFVLQGGFYKEPAIPLAAIEVSTDRGPEPLDAFERFRGETEYELVVGRVLDVTNVHAFAGWFEPVPGEKIAVEVMSLPWRSIDSDRRRTLDARVGTRLEIRNVPLREECERPPLGSLRVGESYLFCVRKTLGPYPVMLIAAHPRAAPSSN